MNICKTLQKAINFHKANQLQEAEKLYKAILAQMPEHPDTNHNLGVLAMQVNKPELALPLFEKALEANPNHQQFQQSLANAKAQLNASAQVNQQDMDSQLANLFKQKKFQEALSLAQDGVNQYPNYAVGWKAIGAMMLMLNEYDKALEPLQKAVILHPNDPDTHSNLGIALKESGKLEEAEASYREAIRLKPDYAEAYSNLGNALIALGRSEEAEKICREAIRLKPDYVKAYNNLGNALKSLGRLEEAGATYRTAIRLKPDYAEAYNNLGNTLKELGRLEEAEASYREAIPLKPDYADAWNNITLLALDYNDYEWYRKYLKNIRKQYPSLIHPKIANATLLTYENKHEQSISYIMQDGTEQIKANQSDAKYEYLQLLAINSWITRELSVAKAASAIVSEGFNPKNKNDKNIYVYAQYIMLLCCWTEKHPLKELTTNNIVMIGDSHCLSGANQNILLDNVNHTISSRLIMGCKAFHLSVLKSNKYTKAMRNILTQLPEKSSVIICIGEIDCRINDGFISAEAKGYIKDISKSISNVVNDYIDFIMQIALKRNIKVIFQGVPAPNIDMSNISIEDEQKLISVIAQFNKVLEERCLQDGNGFIDVYSLTKDNEGISNKQWHIDMYHLKPSIYALANKLFIK